MIVFMNPTATEDQLTLVEGALDDERSVHRELRVLRRRSARSKRPIASSPASPAYATCSPRTTSPPSSRPSRPKGPTSICCDRCSDQFAELPGVYDVSFAEDQIGLISQLQGFFGFRLLLLSVFLLLAAILLIWNTIRTAMFARRREIEVMKLVGATDWFIRIPFMLEGLLHGIIGGVLASAGLWAWNSQWTSGVESFPDNSGFSALVVVDGYDQTVMLIMLAIGALAGAIGSGIAASRFLDISTQAARRLATVR